MAVVALTGGSGFIGQALIAGFAASGWHVRALARSAQAATAIRRAGGEPVWGELSDSASLRHLVAGCSLAVHAAGAVRGADYADFESVNVVGSAQVFDAAERAGVPLVVFSSLAARQPELSHYAFSKRAMERLLDGLRVPAFVLRPPAVYGCGDRELAPLFDALGRGLAPVPSSTGRLSLVHVSDLVSAVLAWANGSRTTGGIYEIHDGRPGGYAWQDIIDTAADLRGAPVRRVGLPRRAVGLAAQVNTQASRLLGHAPMLTPGKVRELWHQDWVADNARLQAVIDWQPQMDFRAGLIDTCDWARDASGHSKPHRNQEQTTDDNSTVRRNLRPLERAARALHLGRSEDRAADQTGGRPGSGFGTDHGSADGARGSAGHLDSDERTAGRADHGRVDAGDGKNAGLSSSAKRITPALFDKFAPINKIRAEIATTGIDPLGVPVDRIISASEAIVRGKHTILAGSNNYLGLTFDETCVEAAVEAVRTQGTGTTGSRMANGSYDGHLALEAELAAFYGVGHAMVFSTGYQANLGMLSALAGPRDTVMLDADCHASIYDGVKLGGAAVLRFKHNDPADLDKRLRRLGDKAPQTLVVVEGVYSMLGDEAPLAELVAVVKRHGACILVDEAHSMGICGQYGRGVVETASVIDEVDFIVGTFSKSLGAAGGFCVSRHPELDMVRYASRPYIFTASPVPAVIASVRAALKRLHDDTSLRTQIWDNAHRLHSGLTALGFTLGAAPGPVVAAMFDSREVALTYWQGLLDRGVYVNLMLPPATPNNQCLVRASLSAAHTPEQIDHIIDAFAAISREMLVAG